MPRQTVQEQPLRTTGGRYTEDIDPESIVVRFGVRLRKVREKKGFTQTDFAIHCGINRNYLSDLERGRKSISLPMMHVLALGLEISLSELMRSL